MKSASDIAWVLLIAQNQHHTETHFIFSIFVAMSWTVCRIYHYVSIIPDRFRSVPILILDRPSISIGLDFSWHDFRNGEGLERSHSESDSICSINLMETHLERYLSMILHSNGNQIKN